MKPVRNRGLSFIYYGLVGVSIIEANLNVAIKKPLTAIVRGFFIISPLVL